MPRHPPRPATALGAAIQARRDSLSQAEVSATIGVTDATLSRLERGTHRPSADTALKLARWLGWSVEEVLEAAGKPAVVDVTSTASRAVMV